MNRNILISLIIALVALLGCEGAILEDTIGGEPEAPWCWLPELPGLCEMSYDEPRDLQAKILATPCPFDSEEIIIGNAPFIQKICRGDGWLLEVAGYHWQIGFAYLLPDMSLIQCDVHDNIVRINPLVIDEFGGYRHLLNDIQLECIDSGECQLVSQYRGVDPCL